LTKESELEGYFIRRVEKIVNAHHRRLVGWSEIRQGGLAANATVMDWVGGAVEAATSGHDVVMSPLADCYFDHYQSLDHSKEPHAIGGYLPLHQVYAFEPMPTNLPAAYQQHILGAQANVWTEYMPSFKHVEYMVFPAPLRLGRGGIGRPRRRAIGMTSRAASASIACGWINSESIIAPVSATAGRAAGGSMTAKPE
jgi:hexosaminidase